MSYNLYGLLICSLREKATVFLYNYIDEKERKTMEESLKNRSNLMIVVYTHTGNTYTFYDVEKIAYHNKKLSFWYYGFAGITFASFNDIAGMTKHSRISNPNTVHDQHKEHYANTTEATIVCKKSSKRK